MPKAVLGVRPTRVELLRLRRREVIARKGHDILQEKLDAMVIRYQQIATELAESEAKNRAMFGTAYDSLKKAGMLTGFETLREISYAVPPAPGISTGSSRIVGIRIPTFSFQEEGRDLLPGYAYGGTGGQVDETARIFRDLLATLIRHAELQGTARVLSQEIISCRRRVNALEQIVIPGLIQTRQYIEMRLEEREREDLFRRKRTKKLLEHHGND